MLMSILKEKDNFFILTEKEMKDMLFSSILKTLQLADNIRVPQVGTQITPWQIPMKTIFSIEQKEFIINDAITEQMKKMKMEID